MKAKRFTLSLLSVSLILLTSSLINSCTKTQAILPQQSLINNNVVKSASKTTTSLEMPVFDKRKLGNLVLTNSVNIQKVKQEKLHTYYFKFYSKGLDHYVVTDTNEHLNMLLKAQTSIGSAVKLDANNDKNINLQEILSFVTSPEYIKDFRKNYTLYSFNKLDKNADTKLVVDEFKAFNQLIKDPSVADFQMLEMFAEYDYDSSRNLDIEEYEDFFMTYLLIKVGAEK